jgi:hypothetical protein
MLPINTAHTRQLKASHQLLYFNALRCLFLVLHLLLLLLLLHG